MKPSARLAEATGSPIAPAISFWNILQAITEQQPDRIAFICAHQPAEHLSWLLPATLRPKPGSAHLEWTYKQLLTIGQNVGAMLVQSGFQAGSNLMVICANNAEWAALFWGCAAVDVAFAPINPGLLGRHKELRHVLETLRPRGIATSDSEWATLLTASCKDLLHAEDIKLRVLFGGGNTSCHEGWVDGQSVFEAENNWPNAIRHPDAEILDLPAVILSTSGTTSMPKLCCHTNRNIDAQTQQYGTVNHINPMSRGVPISPGFHILAICSALSIWRGGGAIIIPSAQFDAAAVVHVLNTFAPTHIACTPAIMYALAAQPGFSSTGYPSLDNVSIGADQVTEELIEQVADTLQPKKIRNGWGMTEGISILGSIYKTEQHPWLSGSQSIGHVLGGSAVKICDPESQEILARGSLGELHMSGPAVIAGYYDRGEIYPDDSFYELDGKTWFKTGDAMIMDPDGWLFMNGRYKDLIIRGGENLPPSLIENCLNKLGDLQAQIIGVEDHFSGQAIVAVIKVDSGSTKEIDTLKERAQNAVMEDLGASFRLTAIYTLSELGLSSFPVTATNKVRKTDLRERARALLEGAESKQNKTNSAATSPWNGTIAEVLKIWKTVLGGDISGLNHTTSILNLADSLAMLRFCFSVEKQLRKRITPADLFANETPELQASFIDGRPVKGLNQSWNSATVTTTAKSLDSIDTTVKEVLRSHLEKMNYTFDTDVEDVYRGIDTMDMFELNTTRLASDNIRLVCQTRHDTTVAHLRECLSRCLIARPALRSIIVPLEADTTTPRVHHVVMKPTEQWMNTLIETVDALTVEDLNTLTADKSRPFIQIGQPCFRAQVFPVKGSERPGLFVAMNHVVFDATFVTTFFEDLDAMLSNKTTESQCIPYGVFADMYHLHKDSALGQASKAYQLKKLDQLENVQSCLWPRSKGPGFMIGDDEGWRHLDTSPGHPSERQSQNTPLGIVRGEPVVRAIEVPALPMLRSRRSIEPFTIVKSAIAIFNVEQTKQDKAVFATAEAGRRWPFQESWVQQHLPNAMHVGGPTLGWAFDFINVEDNECVGDLLHKVGETQKLDTEHCHAPWRSIAGDLGPEKGELLCDIAVRQLLSWDPATASRAQSSKPALESLELVDRRSFPDHGFLWNLGLESPTKIGGFVIYDDVHLSASEVEIALERVLEVAKWLTEPENWGEPVGTIYSRKP